MDKIILNAGHSISDPGAVYNNTTESMEARKIRDYLAKLLERQFEVLIVPDHLNLIESIKWVNDNVKKLNDAVAISIHLNAGGGHGAEAYYYGGNSTSKFLCKTILDKYCDITGFVNRGAKSDRTTRHGRLGWVRDTNCWSILMEACFVSDMNDLNYLHRNLDRVCLGMYEGICKAHKVEPISVKEDLIEQMREILNKLSKL